MIESALKLVFFYGTLNICTAQNLMLNGKLFPEAIKRSAIPIRLYGDKLEHSE